MTERFANLIRVAASAALLATTSQGIEARAAQSGGDAFLDFSLKAAGGGVVSLRRDDGRIRIAHDAESARPRVLVVHFFQPDCLQCQAEAKALQATHQKYAAKRVSVIGIAHRDEDTAQAFAARVGVSYPLLRGTGSDLARRFAAGDTLYIIDERGTVRFSQPGYGSGDEALWHENIELLIAGKPVAKATTERQNLRVGDRMPAVNLQSLMTGQQMSLVGKDGHLTFSDAAGNVARPKAALGLFARYCAFTREEMVQLQKLHEMYANDGLLVFTIALHPRPENAKAITRELGVTYPVFEGYGSDLAKQYGYG